MNVEELVLDCKSPGRFTSVGPVTLRTINK